MVLFPDHENYFAVLKWFKVTDFGEVRNSC
jgi:hypothetical protein